MGASSVTLAQATTIVRDFLDEPVPQQWSNTQIMAYLNMAQADIQRKSESLVAERTIAVTTNVQSYTAPSDTLRIYRLEYVPTASLQTYSLEFRGYNEMDAVWGTYQQYQGAFPSYFTLWSNPPTLSIVVYPVISQPGNLNCFYYRQPVAMVGQSDTMDVLPGFEDVVYDYAVYRCLRQDADPRWQDQFTMYQQNLENLIVMSRRFTDQSNWISTGSSNTPAWLVNGDGWY